jgi:ABC-type Zn uptake system ZnuABC Zn-binding protein ZnuA
MGQLRIRTRATGVALLAVGIMALAACGDGSGAAAGADDGRLRVVTTVAPLTNIVANVAGPRVLVEGLVPEGTNSHTFEPPPSAAKVLAESDVIFLNGLKLEEPTKELAEANKKDGARIVELGSRAIAPHDYIYDFSFPRSGGKPNPHLWTNPPMARRYAEVVAATLAREDPRSAAVYRRNYQRFAAKVDELDRAMRAATATVPRRQLLTYHDAYAYFAEHYGWEVIGAIQPSSFDEPTPRDVVRLIRQVRRTRVPAIFGSEVFPSPVLAQIGRETGARYVDVLRDDDLPGEPGDPEHSWLGLMRFDYITMVESLGGDASALEAVRVENAAPDRARYPQ